MRKVLFVLYNRKMAISLPFTCIVNCLILYLELVAINAKTINWTHVKIMDPSNIFQVRWVIEGDILTMEVSARCQGHVSFGFIPLGANITNADIVRGSIKAGSVVLEDCHIDSLGQTVKDDHQDYELISGHRNKTHTTFQFWRKLNTCDEEDLTIENVKLQFIYAIDELDHRHDHFLADVTYSYATTGNQIVYMMGRQQVMPDVASPDVHYMDFRLKTAIMKDNSVAYSNYSYRCKIFKIPDFKEKHQVIGYKPIINPKHETFIHHMVVYECGSNGFSEEELTSFSKDSNDDIQCRSSEDIESSQFTANCQLIIFNWVAGAEAVYFPSNVGVPLGEEYGGSSYFLLENHYDTQSADIPDDETDDSGLRIYYTRSLRNYDSGSILIGSLTSYSHVVPPGSLEFTGVGFCSSECTAAILPAEGIHIFDVTFHGHNITRSFRFRHFRNNQELEPVEIIPNFDFRRQHTRHLAKEILVLPGDLLLAECIYKPRGPKQVLFGGMDTTSNDMCFVAVSYYPRVDNMQCMTQLVLSEVLKIFELDSNSSEYNDRPMWEKLELHNWTDADVNSLQTLYAEREQTPVCFGRDFNTVLEGVDLVRPPTNITYISNKYTCPLIQEEGISRSIWVSVVVVIAICCFFLVYRAISPSPSAYPVTNNYKPLKTKC